MPSVASEVAVILMGVVGIASAFRYPEIISSPEFGVGMNTFSLALFVMCTEESKEYDGPSANKPHSILRFMSNRMAGALMLVALILFTVYSNIRLIKK